VLQRADGLETSIAKTPSVQDWSVPKPIVVVAGWLLAFPTIPLALAAASPGLAHAQERSVVPEAGLHLSYWDLDTGDFNRIGPTAYTGVYFPEGTPIALRVVGSYAPQGEETPGIFALGAQAAVLLWSSGPEDDRRVALEVLLGYGGLRYRGTTGVDLEDPCGPGGCIEEGVFFRGGWSQVLELGLGLAIPLSSKVFAQPSGALVIPVGDTRDGPDHGVVRVGFGIGWR
jgi:hypothetical protein